VDWAGAVGTLTEPQRHAVASAVGHVFEGAACAAALAVAVLVFVAPLPGDHGRAAGTGG
jgi:hypothetical protein